MKEKIFKFYFRLRAKRLFNMLIKKIIMLENKYLEGSSKATEEIYQKLNFSNPYVCAGPFKGIKYYSKTRAVDAINKIIGTYELELHPIIEKTLLKNYDLVIDIGAAEGYYVIGFAKRWPNLKILAYDNDSVVRKELTKMLEVNNVKGRVNIKEFCDKKELLTLRSDIRALIISDCEGYEYDLFKDDVIKHLKYCDFIIESHDGFDRKVSKTLIKRFKDNNSNINIKIIKQKKRKISDFPFKMDASLFNKLAVMDEGRGYFLRWIFIEGNL